MGVTRGAGTAFHSGAPEFIPSFSGVRVARSLIFYLVVCRSLFVLLSFFFWPLCCRPVFDLRLWLVLWYLQTLLTHPGNVADLRSIRQRVLSQYRQCFWKTVCTFFATFSLVCICFSFHKHLISNLRESSYAQALKHWTISLFWMDDFHLFVQYLVEIFSLFKKYVCFF